MNTPPLPQHTDDTKDWMPYWNRTEFKAAHFIFWQAKMSTRNIDTLLNL